MNNLFRLEDLSPKTGLSWSLKCHLNQLGVGDPIPVVAHAIRKGWAKMAPPPPPPAWHERKPENEESLLFGDV